MLAFQILKINDGNLLLTNQDSKNFPKIASFNRILCDVPCTGDGTLRKNKSIFLSINIRYPGKMDSATCFRASLHIIKYPDERSLFVGRRWPADVLDLLFESIRKRGCCYLGFETFRRIR
jgi:hypothetical protein